VLERGPAAGAPRSGEAQKKFNWMFLVQVSPRDGSFTGRLREGASAVRLDSFGPYRSPYQGVADALAAGACPLLLCASGSGAGLVIDALDLVVQQALSSRSFQKPVRLVYTCNDVHLFQFVTDVACAHLRTLSRLPQIFAGALSVKIALTGNADLARGPVDVEEPLKSVLSVSVGRIDFQEEVGASTVGTKVFFCGAPLLGTIIKQECQTFMLSMIKGHVFGGPTKEQLQRDLMQSLIDSGIDPEQFQYNLDERVVVPRKSPRRSTGSRDSVASSECDNGSNVIRGVDVVPAHRSMGAVASPARRSMDFATSRDTEKSVDVFRAKGTDAIPLARSMPAVTAGDIDGLITSSRPSFSSTTTHITHQSVVNSHQGPRGCSPSVPQSRASKVSSASLMFDF